MKLSAYIQKLLVIQALLILVIMGAVYLLDEESFFQDIHSKFQTDILRGQTQILKAETDKVVTYLDAVNQQQIKELRDTVQYRVEEGYHNMELLYYAGSDKMSEPQLKRLIRDSLRDMKFFEGRGYYFLIGMDGTIQSFPPDPRLELSNIQDLNESAKQVFQEIKAQAQKETGFMAYTPYNAMISPDGASSSPTTENEDKITYVKWFKPFNWIIGIGDKRDESRTVMRHKVMEPLHQLRFGTENTGQFHFIQLGDNPDLSNLVANLQGFGIEAQQALKVSQYFSENRLPQIVYCCNNFADIDTDSQLLYAHYYAPWKVLIIASDNMGGFLNASADKSQQLQEHSMWLLLKFLLVVLFTIAISLFFFRSAKKVLSGSLAHLRQEFREAVDSMNPITKHPKAIQELDPIVDQANIMLEQIRSKTEENKHQATHDVLTGLPNRALMMDRLDQLMVHCSRNQTQFAVLFLDLDHFKNINDTYGHEAGDTLLTDVADTLRRDYRKADTVARLGGDEFVALLPFSQQTDLINIVDRVLGSLRQPYSYGKREFKITGSIGISVYPRDGSDPNELLRKADMAMYQSKKLGKDSFSFFNQDLDTHVHQQIVMEDLLKRALLNEELMLYYQPKISAHDRRIVGVEALMRWKNDELGSVSPEEFIPIAESTGLIVDLGAWAMLKACRDQVTINELGIADIHMAVNLSVKEFEHVRCTQTVQEAMQITGISPDRLEIEITESLSVKSKKNLRTIDELKKIGIQISIDDFGTGYSSLSYLRTMSADTLKIDRSFISDMMTNEKNFELAKLIIQIGKTFNLTVVAEGIEDEATAIKLEEMGCHQMQGFYFGKPMPLKDLLEVLREEKHRLSPTAEASLQS